MASVEEGGEHRIIREEKISRVMELLEPCGGYWVCNPLYVIAVATLHGLNWDESTELALRS